MKNEYKIYYTTMWLLGITLLLLIVSCQKQDDFLDVKGRQSDVSPSTLEDFQAILDNESAMNRSFSIAGLISSDNIYLNQVNLDATDQVIQNYYLWNKDLFQGMGTIDWDSPYMVMRSANIILDGLVKLPDDGSSAYRNVKGSALFHRAYALYRLSQLFCKTYQQTAATDLGVPIRLSSDITVRSVRSTVKETYEQMITDLKAALPLLPKIPLYQTRASAMSVNALLAKIYLVMGDYSAAGNYADQALKIYSSLLDYNILRQVTGNPFPSFAKGNPEIIFFAYTYGTNATTVGSGAKGRVDTSLMKTYQAGDLRMPSFFVADGKTGLYRFKGSYSVNSYPFSGIATNEIWFVRAECRARTGDLEGAAADLNTILKNRYTPASFRPVEATDQMTLLRQILLERRKDMPYTGNLRWEDLRRLNADPAFAKTLHRNNPDKAASLAPGENRYVFPIPDVEIQLSGIPQNPR